jgi:O-succinylbenzoate synthase
MVDEMRARLWRHQMTLTSPVASAAQVHSSRPHLFLELEIEGVRGVGEISPQPETLNGDPGVDDVVHEFVHFTWPQFMHVLRRERVTPDWARITHLAGSRPASYFASALLEMAVLDWHLRDARRTIDDLWPPRYVTPLQRTVSLVDDEPWSDTASAARIRVKVPSGPISPRRFEALSELATPVLLDFNCRAASVQEVLDLVASAQKYVTVAAVEQPFAAGNVVEHSRLASLLDVSLSLDEGVRHRRDLDHIARYRAAQLVCVKPARVGGYAQARSMIERAQQLGLEVYVGGFFESSLARRANRVLARHYPLAPSDVADVDFDTVGELTPDEWGCGYLPGPALQSAQTLLNQQR